MIHLIPYFSHLDWTWEVRHVLDLYYFVLEIRNNTVLGCGYFAVAIHRPSVFSGKRLGVFVISPVQELLTSSFVRMIASLAMGVPGTRFMHAYLRS